MTAVRERSLAPLLSLEDVWDDLLWHRDGTVTVVYAIEAWHEPSYSDDQADQLAWDCHNALAVLPEGSTMQFFAIVDRRRGAEALERAWPEPAGDEGRARLLRAFHSSRRDALLASGVRETRHYVAASFRPRALEVGVGERLRLAAGEMAANLLGRLGRVSTASGFERVYTRTLEEARGFERSVLTALLGVGLQPRRLGTSEIVALTHEILSPTASEAGPVDHLSRRAREERDKLPASVVADAPYLLDADPIGSLLGDDVKVEERSLRVGRYHVGVVSLRELPDATEPGELAPLLRLDRDRYVVSYRIAIPRAGLALAALRAQARWAAGAKLKHLIVESDREDPGAKLIEEQSTEALERVIASTERVFGISLRLVLFEETAEALDEACRAAVSAMGQAHGLRGYRESYLCLDSFLSLVPGAPEVEARQRKALTPTAVDLLPAWDCRSGRGPVPFISRNNTLVQYDPFDDVLLPNANALVVGTSGSGKSFLVNSVLTAVSCGAASAGRPQPYIFILDNGASYKSYCEMDPAGGYVAFTAADPPCVDVFSWSEAAGIHLDDHLARLEELLWDLLHVPEDDAGSRALVEAALAAIYRRQEHPATAAGLEAALEAVDKDQTAALRRALYPYVSGKYARLLLSRKSKSAGVPRVTCFDFAGLEGTKELASVALKLVIFQIRRWSERVWSREHARTLLVLDESWAMLDAGTGGEGVQAAAAPFLAASLRMGRKCGMGTISLSQQIDDFASSAYGAAVLGNSSTKFIGAAGGEVEGLRRHLRLTDRQVEQVRSLRRTPEYHEFLMIRGGEHTDVVRVPGDPVSRWAFTTRPADRAELAALGERKPELGPLDRVLWMAYGGSSGTAA